MAISGSIASANVYRFSSKPVQPNSGLYDYGFRFYDPSLQRWINRDPIGEAGGINVYGFVHNDPLIFVDPDGRHYGSVAADWYQDYAAALMGSTSTCKVYFGMMLDDWAEMFRLGEGAAVGDYSSDLGEPEP